MKKIERLEILKKAWEDVLNGNLKAEWSFLDLLPENRKKFIEYYGVGGYRNWLPVLVVKVKGVSDYVCCFCDLKYWNKPVWTDQIREVGGEKIYQLNEEEIKKEFQQRIRELEREIEKLLEK